MSIKNLRHLSEAQDLRKLVSEHPDGMWRMARLLGETDLPPDALQQLATIPADKFRRLTELILQNPTMKNASLRFWLSDKGERQDIVTKLAADAKSQIDDATFWIGAISALLILVLFFVAAAIGFVVAVVFAAPAVAGIAAVAVAALAVVAAWLALIGGLVYGVLSIIARLMPAESPQVLSVGLEMIGNTWGDPFYDPPLVSGQSVVGFRVRHGARVDSIGLIVKDANGQERPSNHGGDGGGAVEQIFRTNEFITAITCSKDDPLRSVTIHTNYTTYGPYGEPATNMKTLYPRFGTQVMGLVGRSGRCVDALGVMSEIYGSPLAGGAGGAYFLDDWDDDTSAQGNVRSVTIYHGDVVNGVQVEHLHPGMVPHLETLHGTTTGTRSTLVLDMGERITQISGRSGSYVDKITITTNKRSESWGGNGGGPFTFTVPNGKVFTGFWGRSGANLDAIGITTATAPAR